MKLPKIIDGIVELGNILGRLDKDSDLINKAYQENPWFVAENQWRMLRYWHKTLNHASLETWLKAYHFCEKPKNVGVIMAGNIPLVGLHDLLCILVSGHNALIKPSREDTVLPLWLIETLFTINPAFKSRILVVDKLNDCNALLATGSDNSARYFNYYFNKIPRVIRKNRHGIAVLGGDESEEELGQLGEDIFSYFGLGCRNVSKIFLPSNYNLKHFFEAIEGFSDLKHHNKYFNNYTYHKAIFLMNLVPHFDNGFLLAKEDERLSSPLGCIFYSYYDNLEDVKLTLELQKESVQVVMCKDGIIQGSRNFGQSQNPMLADYADGIDTLAFLNQI